MYMRQLEEKSGKIRLVIYESYWRDGKSRNRIVKTLGFLEDLKAEHDDPVRWGKELAKKMTDEKKASEQAIKIEIHPQQKIDSKRSARKNIGSAAILSQYAALRIPEAIRAATKNMKIKYDINSVLRLLVCERIVNPGSKLSAWENRDKYFFKSEFTDDDLYRSLDIFGEYKSRIISAINREISRAGIRDLSAVYYDVTNYYFEIDCDDDLRRRGVSKENRTKPIVQMGLLQDAKGIPISYKLFPGNTLDCQTLIPVLEDLKQDHKLDRVVTVADKGLNSSDNIAATVAKGDGFVFSQSVRGTKSDTELREWVLDESGYSTSEGFKIKSKQGYKTVHLKPENTSTGKPQDVKVDVKYVAFWSEKYAIRARKERQKIIEKACDLIKNPGEYTRATSHGAAGFVKNLHFNKQTGEIVDGNQLLLDEEAIAKAEALDGFYLIVTSETDWDDEKILQTYRELWRIEESFKVTKSEIRTRPVYVWTESHIEAHFLTCYISLVILRLLQNLTGLSCSQIKENISSMSGSNFADNWWSFDHRTQESDKLVDALDLQDLKRANLQSIEIRKLIAKAVKTKLR